MREQLLDLGKTVTILDSDEIRPILCPDLGFSREDRRKDVLRLAYVSREIVRHSGIAIIATISPIDEDRKQVRSQFDPGCFLHVRESVFDGV